MEEACGGCSRSPCDVCAPEDAARCGRGGFWHCAICDRVFCGVHLLAQQAPESITRFCHQCAATYLAALPVQAIACGRCPADCAHCGDTTPCTTLAEGAGACDQCGDHFCEAHLMMSRVEQSHQYCHACALVLQAGCDDVAAPY